jgi:hypothetical protein
MLHVSVSRQVGEERERDPGGGEASADNSARSAGPHSLVPHVVLAATDYSRHDSPRREHTSHRREERCLACC